MLPHLETVSSRGVSAVRLSIPGGPNFLPKEKQVYQGMGHKDALFHTQLTVHRVTSTEGTSQN